MERWLGSHYTEQLARKTSGKQNAEERKKICDEMYAIAQNYLRKPALDQLYKNWLKNKPVEEFHLNPIKIQYLDRIYNVLGEDRQEELPDLSSVLDAEQMKYVSYIISNYQKYKQQK